MTVREKLEANDVKFGREAKMAGLSRSERISELRTQMASAQNEIEKLEREQAQENNPNVAVTGDPAIGLIRDNTGVDGQAPEGAPERKEDYSDTKRWTVPSLQAEIEARNIDRKAANLSEMSTQGKRAELVERLQQDDKELEEAEG